MRPLAVAWLAAGSVAPGQRRHDREPGDIEQVLTEVIESTVLLLPIIALEAIVATLPTIFSQGGMTHLGEFIRAVKAIASTHLFDQIVGYPRSSHRNVRPVGSEKVQAGWHILVQCYFVVLWLAEVAFSEVESAS